MTQRTPPAAITVLQALERDPQAVEELAPAAIEAGATTREVAAIVGVNPRTVSRRWGHQPGRGARDRPDVRDGDVLVLYHQGLSQAAIAATLTESTTAPVSRGLVRRRLARYGLAASTRHP